MRKNKFLTLSLYLVLTMLFFVVGCNSSSSIIPLASTQASVSDTDQVTLTFTEIPPSRTATEKPTTTPAPTNTNTPTSTPTITPSLTSTPSPQPLVLEFIEDSVCMMGASYGHKVDHYVNRGTIYPLLGQLMDHSWWLVKPDDGDGCWANADVVSVQGDVDTLPMMTPPPLPTLTPSSTPEVRGVYYMLIAENTGGPFGCGDDLIKYFPGVWVKGGMEDDILGALNALFSNHSKYVNGLYNPMYQSDLRAKSVKIVGNDVVIQLAGTLVRPENKCESKRMHDQVWFTARQFSSVRPVIYLNQALLGDLLVVSK